MEGIEGNPTPIPEHTAEYPPDFVVEPTLEPTLAAVDEVPLIEEWLPEDRRRRSLVFIFVIVLIIVAMAVLVGFALSAAWGEFFRESPEAVLHNTSLTATGVTVIDSGELSAQDMDVWVENVGSAPLLVRIRLNEYMQGRFREDDAVRSLLNPNYAIPEGVDGRYLVAPTEWSTHGLGLEQALLQDTQYARQRHRPNLVGLRRDPFFARGVVWIQPAFLTFEQWRSASESNRSNKWVLADDGYAYYTAILKPGEETSLLLNGVIVPFEYLNPGCYLIDVLMDITAPEDAIAWYDGIIVQRFSSPGNPVLAPVKASRQGTQILDSILR